MLPHLAFVVIALQQQGPARDSTRPDSSVHRLQAVNVREVRAHRYTARAITSATKTETPLRDTPQSVTVLSRALLSEQSMQSMADAMRYVPGVTMGQGEGHRDAPTIRGQSTTADFFVDGVRDDAQYFRDFYNLERVELLSGSNAMTFGRGGGGGVVNRVLKRASWEPARELTLEGGSYDHVRGTLDVGGAITPLAAARLNAMSEHSGTFRDAVEISRVGVNPTFALMLGARTMARVGAEYFEDHRVVDRGIPSFRGAPSPAPRTTFFGNPDSSRALLHLRAANAELERRLGDRTSWRTQARVTRYDKFYQNVFPAAVDSSGANVNLSAYNNAHDRTNGFVQSEVVARHLAGSIGQTFLVGIEGGRQATDNFRNTGFFNGTSPSVAVPFAAPTVSIPVAFRQNPTDADNYVVVNTASFYIQDQLAFGARWEATFGARAERFAMRVDNHRNGDRLGRRDDLLSPRAGLVFKATPGLSAYSSYSVSHLPSSGDQFSSLTATTQALEPERFTNREVGVKWDPLSMLSLTAAAYRLDRTNTSTPDPTDPARLVQTGRQRSSGVELTASGRMVAGWDVFGTYTSQTATIVSRTSAAPAGARVPLVPRDRFALWNRVQAGRLLGVGLGAIHQGASFAAIDNSVRLPAFWRLDGAVFLTSYRSATLQANVENLFDARYFPTTQGNNNILPGAPRTLRIAVTTTLGPLTE